jgi:hypothetical protein
MNKKIYLFIAIIALASISIASTGEWRPPPIDGLGEDGQRVLDMLMGFICGPIYIIIAVSSAIASLLLIIAGARYVVADDPGTRTELRRFMTGIIIGLVIVMISVPSINYIINGILPGVQCENINGSIDDINTVFCNLINVLSTIGPWLCALLVVYGGLRYLSSAEDPGARKAAKTTLIAAFVGMIIIMLAIPLVNMVLADALAQVNCPQPTQGPITDQMVAILENFLCIISLIAPPICALVVTYGGLRYITSAEDPGARDTAKTIIISALIGMVLVILTIPLVNMALIGSFTHVTFNCGGGQVTEEITDIMCNFMCFLSFIAPAVCALVVIYGAIRYLVSGDDPGSRRIAKTIIVSAFVGLILVLLSTSLVNLVLTNLFGQVSCPRCAESDAVRQVIEILCKFICLFASIAPAISALVIILGGVRYVTSAEDPAARKAAKTMIVSAIVGLILVMISLSVVNLFVSGIAEDVQCGCFNIQDPARQISDVLCTLACTLQMVTPAIAVIVILYGGLKYLTTGDDPGARASARGIVIQAIIGLVFVMLAIEIVNIVILNIMPTFRCNCAQLFPSIYGMMASSDSVSNPPEQVFRVQGVGSEDICAKCCGVGKTECHYSYLEGTETKYNHYPDVKITSCEDLKATKGYYKVTAEGTGERAGTLVDALPPANAKCVYCPDGTLPGECNGDKMCIYTELGAEPQLNLRSSVVCAAKKEAENACTGTKAGKCTGNGWMCVCDNGICKITYDPLCIKLVIEGVTQDWCTNGVKGCGSSLGGLIGGTDCVKGYKCVGENCVFDIGCCSKTCGESSCGTAGPCGSAEKCVGNSAGTDCECKSEAASCCGKGYCGNSKTKTCGSDELCLPKSGTTGCICQGTTESCAYASDNSCIEKVCGVKCPGKSAPCKDTEVCQKLGDNYECLAADNYCTKQGLDLANPDVI